MSDQKLIDTIKHKLSLGIPEDEIIKTLVSLGWKNDEIKNALSSNNTSKTSEHNQAPAPLIKLQPKKEEPETTIVFDDEKKEITQKKKGRSKSQVILTALIIFITLIGAASFIFLEEIKKIDASQISIEKIISLFTGKTDTEKETPPIVQTETPPINSGDMMIYGPYNVVGELMMSNGNFTFFYEKDDSQYINFNGSSYGPYQRTSNKGIPRPIVPSIYNDKFGFSYYDKEKNSWYVNINGNVSGPYSEVSNVYYSASGYIFAGKKKESIYYYVNINGNEDTKKPYVVIEDNIYLSDDGSYGFSYISNNKRYINMNGKVFGPYSYNSNNQKEIVMYRDNKFYILYSDGKEYVNVNGSIFESTGSIVSDYLKNEFEFHYNKEDNKEYINLNGKEILNEESIALATNYVFKNGSEYFVNAGDKKEGPYKKTTIVSKDGDSYIFGYQLEDGQWFININGVGNGPYQDISPLVFINKNKSYGYIYEKDSKWYVQVK